MVKRGFEIKGFTLIEVIIVIAILAIMTLVIVPNLIGVKSSAQKTVNGKNISTVKNALDDYYARYEGYPKVSGDAGVLRDKLVKEDPVLHYTFLSKLPSYKDGTIMINSYGYVPAKEDYTIKLKDDPQTSIDESDAKYEITSGTDTSNLFK